MTHPTDTPPARRLQAAFGLLQPAPGWLSWLIDAHLLLALLAAIPIWIALGATDGDRLRVPVGAIAWLALLLWQPLVEELVFRGLMQGKLLALTGRLRTGPVSVANLCTTLAFIIWHLTAQPAAWALVIAAPSLVFGHLRERFGSVLPAMLVHIVYNAGFGLTAYYVQR